MFPHHNLCAFLFFLIQVPHLRISFFWVFTQRVVVISFTSRPNAEITRVPHLCRLMYNISSNLDFLRRETFGPSPNPQDGGPPIFCCPRLLTRFIDNCLVYLLAVFIIRNLQTIRAEVQSACHSLSEGDWTKECFWRLCLGSVLFLKDCPSFHAPLQVLCVERTTGGGGV